MLGIATAVCMIVSSHSESIAFKRSVLDTRFVAEGVAVGDVDRDGKLDVLAGNVWYRAPKWEPHEIAPVAELDPKTQYSNCFHAWAEDLNKDGWVDQIVIGMPGEKAIWRENPKGENGPWKEHLIWPSAGNESPLYEDLLGNGKKALVMGTDDEYLGWFEPSADPYAPWAFHRISGLKGAGSQRYSHGLGIGDLDGDGKNEVMTTGGYYVAPKGTPGDKFPVDLWNEAQAVDPAAPSPDVHRLGGGANDGWTFVPADLGPNCAHMISLGPNMGILSSSAHARGVWWHQPAAAGGFKRTLLDESISQTHAAALVRLGKAQTPNLVTGKRKWAHPPGVDVGSDEPSWLVRYERGTDGKWTRHLIDEDSGVGTQFVVQDMDADGRTDIVISNKNGVFVFHQSPTSSERSRCGRSKIGPK